MPSLLANSSVKRLEGRSPRFVSLDTPELLWYEFGEGGRNSSLYFLSPFLPFQWAWKMMLPVQWSLRPPGGDPLFLPMGSPKLRRWGLGSI